MAVTVAGSVESERTGTTDPHTWSHDQGTTSPQGVVVAVVHGTSSTDHVLGVTYGAVALTRIQRNTDTSTEPGAAELWFRGDSIPTGTQTVSADLASGTTDDIHFVSMTLDGDGDLAVVDQDGINENAANPSVTLQYTGRTCMAFAALYGGGVAPTSFTENADCTRVADFDIAAFYSVVLRQTTAGTADFAIGGTAGSDDVAYAAIAISEKVVAADATSAGSASLTGIGAALALSDASSAGIASDAIIGASVFTGVMASAGVATDVVVGAVVFATVMAATGTATVSADGENGGAVATAAGSRHRSRSRLWPDPRVKPPFGSVSLDDGYASGWYWSLAEGAGTSFTSLGFPRSLVNQVPTKMTWGVGPGGLAIVCDGSISNLADCENVVTGPPFSLYAVLSTIETSLPYTEGIVSCCASGGSNIATIYMTTAFNLQFFSIDQFGGGNLSITTSGGGFNDGRVHWALARAASLSSWDFYVDGRFIGSSTTASGGFAWTKSLIGEDSVNNGQAFKGNIYAAGIWPSVIQPQDTPYAFLRPIIRRRYFVPAAAAAGNPWHHYRQQQHVA